MKKIIGLDIGTNSIGWAFVKEDNNKNIDIINTGVSIFQIGTIVDEKSGKEKTKNEQRREFRGASRMRYRFKLRRKHLKSILSNKGMLPDFAKYYNKKEMRQSFKLYEYRAKALDEKIPLDELGRIFLLINKHRGFQSNAKKLKKEDREKGAVDLGISELKKLMDKKNARTIGEYFYFMHKMAKDLYDKNRWHNDDEPIDEHALNEDGDITPFNSNGIRRHFGRYTLRDMYKFEFDEIWKEQKKYYSDLLTGSYEEYSEIRKLPYNEKVIRIKKFRETLYWQIREYCIFYQRPLKSQKKYVSNCQFERNKKVIPVSHPLYQEFRIYKQLHDIRFSDDENINQPLKKEWIDILVNALKTNYRIYLKAPKKPNSENCKTFHSVLNISNDSVKFIQKKSDSEKFIIGNTTFSTFCESLGKDKFDELEKNCKLDLLWHHIYISKDGLFKGDEWLMDILTEKTKWCLEKVQAEKLITNGLEEEYGSYSSKVIKNILPYMRDGNDEYTSLIKAKYLKSPDEVSEDISLNEKISQLKYQELRNPVVEKAVSQAIKVVNCILEKYKNEIDRENLEIRIESTRELRKPREERENIRKNNMDKERIREEYAKFLNDKKNELGVYKKIEKYDSLINKFELWLEMGMDDNDGRFNEKDFMAFNKVTKPLDKLKHKLWLECNRICPYSNKIISLSKLFSSEIEIEHIIPLSRSLDDSYVNKTLTFSNINKEKGKMTAYEYMKNNYKDFKKRIESANFSEEKIKNFLKQKVDIEFSNNQISNSSYIAKYVKLKMFEVCKNVQFTNGFATSELRINDWKISNLLDKIRFEEETGNNVDEIFENYYIVKNEFKEWYQNRYKTTDFKIEWNDLENNYDLNEFQKETKLDFVFWYRKLNEFNQFRNKSGKKDRTDHRHHAIDAFITACCSPSIIKILSTLNAKREEMGYSLYDDSGNITRNKIDKNFNYYDLKNSIMNIIVNHYEKQILIKKRINRIKTKNGIIKVNTYAPQGSLHEESFYGKRNGNYVRRVLLFDDKRQDKILFSELKDLEYQGKGEKWHYIPENTLYEVTKKRIEKFGKDAFKKEFMEIEPFYMKSNIEPDSIFNKNGKPFPVIKSVRQKFNYKRSIIQLANKDEDGNIINKKRFVNNESNFMMVYYKNSLGKRFAKPISFFESVKRKQRNEKLIPDEIDYRGDIFGLDKDLPWVKIGDVVFLFLVNENIDTINWNDNFLLSKRLYKVKGIYSSEVKSGNNIYEFGYVSLLNIKCAKDSGYPSKNDVNEALNYKSFKLSHVKFNAIKIRLNSLGEVIKKGKECF